MSAPTHSVAFDPCCVSVYRHWLERNSLYDKRNVLRTAPPPNIYQTRAHEAYEHSVRIRKKIRLIGCKIRQIGGSAVAAHQLYCHCRRVRSRGITIADTNAKSTMLFEKIRTIAQNDRTEWGHDWTVRGGRMRFGEDWSYIQRMSAEAPRQSRGETITAAAITEPAWYRAVGPISGDEVAISLANALADHEDTFCFLDSTPHGPTGFYADTWAGASWPDWDGPEELVGYYRRYAGAGGGRISGKENDYIRVFAAWWEHPENRLPESGSLDADQRRDLLETMSETERGLVELYALEMEQLAWRRWAIVHKCRGSVNRFNEEYPSDPISCFLVSGSPVFHPGGMTRLERMAQLGRPEVGTLVVGRDDKARPSLTRDAHGNILVWERPRDGCSYLIAIDPMTGEQEIAGGERDNHSVLVLRAGYVEKTQGGAIYHNPAVVARILAPCQWDNGPLAREVSRLSRYYGDCAIIAENNQGKSLLVRLRDDFHANLLKTDGYDRDRKENVVRLGWTNTSANRDVVIDVACDAVREGAVDIWCPHSVGELSVFHRSATGRREAPSTCHDDDVMSLAIGLTHIGSATVYRAAVDRYHDDSRDGYEEY